MDALPKKLFVTEMTANLGIFKGKRQRHLFLSVFDE